MKHSATNLQIALGVAALLFGLASLISCTDTEKNEKRARGIPQASVEIVFCVLRQLAHSSIPGKGCTNSSRCSAARTRESGGAARSRRATPPRSLRNYPQIEVRFHVSVLGRAQRAMRRLPQPPHRQPDALKVMCDAIGSQMDFFVITPNESLLYPGRLYPMTMLPPSPGAEFAAPSSAIKRTALARLFLRSIQSP